ncbi:MAG: DegV family protein [Clostridia bacterium]|nr:DegV family protein [Clostridia bacterium]
MIITIENTCDLTNEKIEELGVKVIKMKFTAENESLDTNKIDIKEFYNLMRTGEVFRTSQVNEFEAKEFFEKYIEQDDILHLSFTSGLSASLEAVKRVAEEINAKNEHKVYVVDTLCASAGQGLFCELIVKKLKETNCNIQELVNYAEELKYDLAHYFTVDELKYLVRGGRVSKTSAFIGKLLTIKPILRIDRKGKIVAMSKVISRKKSLQKLAELYNELADKTNDLVYISHADCEQDANLLKEQILNINPNAKIEIYQIGATIGSHCGPGTLALFFVRRHDYFND